MGQWSLKQGSTVAVLPPPVGLDVGRVAVVPLPKVLSGLVDLLVPSLSPLRRERKLALGVVWSCSRSELCVLVLDRVGDDGSLFEDTEFIVRRL